MLAIDKGPKMFWIGERRAGEAFRVKNYFNVENLG